VNSVQILDRLVGFPTVSCDSNLALIEFVRDFLAARGVEARLYMDAEGRKANLYASIGPAERGGVLLSGHTDVVPVEASPGVPIRSGCRNAARACMRAARPT